MASSRRGWLQCLPRSWGLTGFVRGRLVAQRRFQFIFPSEESLATVICRGPWSFADRMLVLERWSPNDDPPMLNVIPFWIQIRGIPLHFLNLGVIDSIARSLGDVMGVDFDEATATRVQFVRVQVKWNVEKPLRFQRNFQFSPGVNTTISFFYERLRGFCEVCGMMTHDSGNCLIQNGGPENSDGDDDIDGDHVVHGNPEVHIQELDEDGQPMADNEAEEHIIEDDHNVEPATEEALSDIDPNHNALEHYSSGDSGDFLQRDENALLNPLPPFVNVTGNILGPIETLARDLRKRKSDREIGEASGSSQKRKINKEDYASLDSKTEPKEEESNTTALDGAAVGPVPPPVP